jgi:hypothetical protein
LRRKAEKKLKEVNTAYEKLNLLLSSQRTETSGRIAGSRERTEAGSEEGRRIETEARDPAEVIAEAGTRIALTFWSYLTTKVRQILDNQNFTTEVEERSQKESSSPGLSGKEFVPQAEGRSEVIGKSRPEPGEEV